MNGIQEIPVVFGPEQSLIGMVCAPVPGSDAAPVACLMFNMGATHRIGPRRINVKLARHLAERGVSSIRLDLSGLGDSGAPRGAEHFVTQAVQDLQAAMDQVESVLGIRRFVVIGLCSGATNGLALAAADARVVGIFMFDGYAFPGLRARVELALRRAVAACGNPAVVAKTWRWLHRRISSRAAAAMAPSVFDDDEPPAVAGATFRRSMTQLAERQVAVMLFYTGTLHVVDRGRDQLGAVAREPFMRDVRYHFAPDIDHSLTHIESQRRFVAMVGEWVLGLPVSQPAADAPALPLQAPSRAALTA